MVLSSPVLGSDRKLGPISYIFIHCIPTGFQSIFEAYELWSLHMKGDTKAYRTFGFLTEDEKLENVRLDFWHSINESEVMEKEFLEFLAGAIEDVDSGKVDLVPVFESELNEIKELLK